MSDCLFCRIVAGEIPAEKVHEDEHTIAFMDINPVTRGHLLVVPKAHSRDMTDIDPGDLAATMRTAQELTRRVLDALGAEGAHVVNNCRPAAGQTVFHFHVHVVPRTAGDGFHVPLGGPPADQDELARTAARIREG